MTSAFSTSEAIQYGFSRFGEESGYCFGLLGAAEIISLVSSSVVAWHLCVAARLMTQMDSLPPDAIVYAFVPTYFVVRTMAQVPVNKALLMLHDGRKITREDLLGFEFGQNFSAMMRMMGASFVYTISSIFLTLIFVLPAVFATSMMRFFKFAIVDKETDAMDGLRMSYELSGESKGELISLNVLSSAIRLVGLLCLGIGFIPASAICGLAEAYAYKKLTMAHDNQLQHAGTVKL